MHRPSENIHDVRRRGLRWLAGAIVVVILSLIAFLLFVLLDSRFEALEHSQSTEISTATLLSDSIPSNGNNITSFTDLPTSTPSHLGTSTIQTSYTMPVNMVTQSFRKVLVSSPIGFCSEIGRNVILQGGNAIDAAVATHFCVGGLHPHSSGLGGELVLLLHTGNSTVVVNGQVRSARSVTENTYASKPTLKDEGYASIAVPGALHALYTSFRKFGSGRVAWQSLIWPTVEFLERGYPATAELVTLVNAQPTRGSLLGDVPSPLKEGDILKNVDYADSLRRLAQSRDPIHMFYKGDIGNIIVNEMKDKGGLLTKLDLVSYESTVEEPLFVHFNDNYTLVGPPPPSAFAAYQLGVRLTLDSRTSSSNVILKAMQSIGDPSFFPESRMLALNLTSTEFKNFVADLNTSASSFLGDSTDISSITVTDASGAIASVDSTLYSNFGSLRKSDKLGFIWNNGMSAFSLSEDEEDFNSVQGGKRARTRMAPIILLQNKKWRLAAHPHRLLDRTATCIAGLIRPEEIKEPCDSVVIENLDDNFVHKCPNNWEAYHCQGTRGY